ncbi:potassium channel family protein [Reyranella sp.]|uniref:potassium channel family protein n=1 Tax=Reyranella sp. TaxID=1929291 RepID=UPI003D148A5A
MLVQLAVGLFASFVNIVIHSLIMVSLIRTARARGAGMRASSWHLAGLMSPVVCLLMMAHVGEVAIWTLTYALTGAAPEKSDILYFAFVNYTTLGYGDMIPVERWRLLGPITAMNGVLLFGWSTAVIFEVLRRALIRLDQDMRPL